MHFQGVLESPRLCSEGSLGSFGQAPGLRLEADWKWGRKWVGRGWRAAHRLPLPRDFRSTQMLAKVRAASERGGVCLPSSRPLGLLLPALSPGWNPVRCFRQQAWTEKPVSSGSVVTSLKLPEGKLCQSSKAGGHRARCLWLWEPQMLPWHSGGEGRPAWAPSSPGPSLWVPKVLLWGCGDGPPGGWPTGSKLALP